MYVQWRGLHRLQKRAVMIPLEDDVGDEIRRRILAHPEYRKREIGDEVSCPRLKQRVEYAVVKA